jgi:tRNA/tmRNA/rRNA uracil-C5-methylase (TrmA/RlmC/RlmD family)
VNKTESWVGRSFEVAIEKVAHGGIFVARHESRVVFVSHVLPGERVKVRVFEDGGKGFCRAEPIEILEPSVDRVPHIWAEGGVGGAGGAEFGHIRLARQRELKADVLEEALDRFAGLKLRVAVEAAPGDDENNGLGYRSRIQLHVDEQGFVGPYRERSHEVVRVKSLPLATEDIQELEFHHTTYQSVGKIEVMASSTGQVQWLIDKKLQGDERLIERAGGRTFRITGGGFWQVHRKAPDVLTSAVNDFIEKAGVLKLSADNLDLYGGVGLFTGTIAAKFGESLRMTTVESFKQATADATLNLKDLPNVKAVCEPVERFLAPHKDETGEATVVLDPPRSGAGGKVVGQLLKLAPKHIVYVACDPIALARDLKTLMEHYDLAGIRSFDLFPHTHHLETIASLVRK